MKKCVLKVTAVILLAAMLLTGCAGGALLDGFWRLGALLGFGGVVSFDRMGYIRPDVEAYQSSLDHCLELIRQEADVETLMEGVWDFFTLYHDFCTNYFLADIHYCQDMTDIFWSEEYNYCLEHTAEIDGGMDSLLYALADSPLKAELESEAYFGAGYFDAYTGESIWDETFTAMAEEESALVARYYDLCGQASDEEYYSAEYFAAYWEPMAQLLAELVALRQRMAAYTGYEDYTTFAYDYYYGRDYTPDQAEEYLERIREELVPLYESLPAGVWDALGTPCSTDQTYAFVKELATNAGGMIRQAFALMDGAKLYDIAPGANKYDASFEVFLPSYYEPFIFVNPAGAAVDQLTFAHEFGHFCNDYASGGSVAGVDVAEIFSQGMEYLSLDYTKVGENLTRAKMADSLSVYVEQAAYAVFEQRLYALEPEALTPETITALYGQVGTDFGFDKRAWDNREFIAITHFFTNPMYIISYVVSNDAALQIYQREQQEAGTGMALLQGQLATRETSLLAFLEAAGLESPFAEGRIESVRDTLRAALGETR